MKRLLTVLLLLTAAAFAQNGAQGTLTVANAACVSGSCVSVQFDSPSVGGATIQLSGAFTATVQFEASNDGGTTFVAINGTPANSTTGASSATTANVWQFNVAGYTNIRARCSAFTSAPTVVIRSTVTSAKSGGGGGSFTGGTLTSPLLAAVGTCNNPPIAFNAAPTFGFFLNGSAVDVCLGGTAAFRSGANATTLFGSLNNLIFAGAKGQHIQTQAANNDLVGTCTAAAATTCVVTFTTAYGSAPVCMATDQTNITTVKVTPTTTNLTITTSASSSDVFAYNCMGNPS